MPSCLTLGSLVISDCCAIAAQRFALNRRPIAVNEAEVNRCLMQSRVLVGVPPAGTNSYPRLKVLTIGTGVAVEAKVTAFGVFVPVPGALPLMMMPKRCVSAAS